MYSVTCGPRSHRHQNKHFKRNVAGISANQRDSERPWRFPFHMLCVCVNVNSSGSNILPVTVHNNLFRAHFVFLPPQNEQTSCRAGPAQHIRTIMYGPEMRSHKLARFVRTSRRFRSVRVRRRNDEQTCAIEVSGRVLCCVLLRPIRKSNSHMLCVCLCLV